VPCEGGLHKFALTGKFAARCADCVRAGCSSESIKTQCLSMETHAIHQNSMSYQRKLTQSIKTQCRIHGNTRNPSKLNVESMETHAIHQNSMSYQWKHTQSIKTQCRINGNSRNPSKLNVVSMETQSGWRGGGVQVLRCSGLGVGRHVLHAPGPAQVADGLHPGRGGHPYRQQGSHEGLPVRSVPHTSHRTGPFPEKGFPAHATNLVFKLLPRIFQLLPTPPHPPGLFKFLSRIS
jgi:hypothetical protein